MAVDPRKLNIGDTVNLKDQRLTLVKKYDRLNGYFSYSMRYEDGTEIDWLDQFPCNYPWCDMTLVEKKAMGVDPKKLKVGDLIKFGDIVHEVTNISHDLDSLGSSEMSLKEKVDNGLTCKMKFYTRVPNDFYPWDCAELVGPDSPKVNTDDFQKEIESLQSRLKQQITINADLRNNIDDLNDNINTMKLNIDELTEENARLFKLGQFLEAENDSLDGLVMYYKDIETLQNSRIENYISRIKQLKQE